MDFVDTFTLKGLERLTDDEFFHFCQQNRDLRIERTCKGEVIIMSPTGSRTGMRNSEINFQLQSWNKQRQAGYVFDSSTGFKLPNGSERSPDASVGLAREVGSAAVGGAGERSRPFVRSSSLS